MSETSKRIGRWVTRPRLAMAIMLYLGVRRSDAVLIGRKHEGQDGHDRDLPDVQGPKKGVRSFDASDPATLARDP